MDLEDPIRQYVYLPFVIVGDCFWLYTWLFIHSFGNRRIGELTGNRGKGSLYKKAYN